MELDEECEVSPNVLVHDDSVLRTPLKSTLMLKDPEPGMKFKTVKDAVDYYTEYGRQKGFDVRIRGSDRKQRGTNRVTSFLLCCQREGTHEKIVGECEPSMQRNTSTCKCDCKAGMRCCWKKDGFYEVSVFKMIHNHDFFSPSKGMMMKANKNFPEAARNLTKRFSEEGLPIAKVAAVFGGSTIGFSGKDGQNHFGKTKKNPKKGDATAVLEFFKQKNIEDPLFFYAVQLDDEARATNFFWVDGRCRMQYDLFGDVVVFDTTYKTNAYSMPFAPFTGVNHHLQSIQFGCALLLDETEETFVWLFKTWLAAMGGRPPTSILTDQDRAMTAAVGRVFPDTVHRFCLWHITNKFPSKFAQVIHKNETFSDELKLIISCCYRIHDFEEKWSAHMLKYGLEKDSWVIELYDMRARWIPAFHLDIFYAGMNTTGRSESINSLYDVFVTHNTNLIDFVHGNDRLLAGIAFEENEFDFRSEHKTPIVKDRGALLLKHAGKVYTKKVYLKFQKQWKFASNDYKIEKEEVQVDGYTIYTLRSRNRHNSDYWIVNFNVTTKEGDCECKHFQFLGILCGHLLKVLLRHDIDEIPSHFILRRWRQRANTYRSIFDNGGRPSDRDDFQTLRCTNLLRYTTELSSHCSSHGDDYEYAMDMIKSIFIEVDRRKEARNPLDVNTTSAETINEPPLPDPTQILLLNPNISQTKGRKKHADRIKRGIETAQDKNSPGASQGVQKRGCTRCKNGGMEYIGHDWRTCVNNPNPNSKQNRN